MIKAMTSLPNLASDFSGLFPNSNGGAGETLRRFFVCIADPWSKGLADIGGAWSDLVKINPLSGIVICLKLLRFLLLARQKAVWSV